jgi:hypothetical protein
VRRFLAIAAGRVRQFDMVLLIVALGLFVLERLLLCA